MDVILWNSSPESARNNRSLGAYIIANHCRANNISCQVIDFIDFLSYDQLAHLTKLFIAKNTKVIGISTTFLFGDRIIGSSRSFGSLKPHIAKVIAELRREFPYIKFVAGGDNVDIDDISSNVDAVFSNNKSAEDDFINYVVGYTEQAIKKYSFDSEIFRFAKRDFILSDDILPLRVSTGCQFKCSFCGYNNLGNLNIKDMSLIEDELTYNYNTFGVTKYSITDSTFNNSYDKIKDFFEMTKRLPFKIRYRAFLRLDLIYKWQDTIEMLKESGLVHAFFGVESFNKKSLEAIGKHSSYGDVGQKDFILYLAEKFRHDCIINLGFIIGLPDEELGMGSQLIEWLKENNCDGRISILADALRVYNYSSVEQKDKDMYKLSEIEKDPHKFGISFNDNGWLHGDWTEELAIKEALRIKQFQIDMARKSGALISFDTETPSISRYSENRASNYYNLVVREMTKPDLLSYKEIN